MHQGCWDCHRTKGAPNGVTHCNNGDIHGPLILLVLHQLPCTWPTQEELSIGMPSSQKGVGYKGYGHCLWQAGPMPNMDASSAMFVQTILARQMLRGVMSP